MKLNEFIEELSRSQLYGLAVSKINDPEKGQYRKEQIITWINIAITKIYREFNLDQNAVAITKEIGKNEYRMEERYMNIIDVYCQDRNIPINRSDRTDSIFTPRPYIIDIPEVFNGMTLEVYYSRAPKKIKDDEDFIELEPQYFVAMMLYISYLANELIKGAPQWEHQSFLTKYQAEISQLRREGLVPHTGIINKKMYQKGFI